MHFLVMFILNEIKKNCENQGTFLILFEDFFPDIILLQKDTCNCSSVSGDSSPSLLLLKFEMRNTWVKLQGVDATALVIVWCSRADGPGSSQQREAGEPGVAISVSS